MLTERQIARYSRQIILPTVGGRGQQQLLSATVAVAGRAGMARVAALYLAAAGIGRLFLIGEDRATCDDLELLNPDCHVTGVEWPLADESVERIVGQSLAVVCADADTATVSRWHGYCMTAGRPLLYGRVVDGAGEATMLGGGSGVECVSQHVTTVGSEGPDVPRIGTTPPDLHSVLAGAVAGFLGTVLATEVIKLTLNLASALAGRRLTYHALSGQITTTDNAARPDDV